MCLVLASCKPVHHRFAQHQHRIVLGDGRSRMSLGSPGSLGPIPSSEGHSAADRGSMTARSRRVLSHLEVPAVVPKPAKTWHACCFSITRQWVHA